jgi:ABC-type transport system involved in multi-copper enzyme maturation permease subunit
VIGLIAVELRRLLARRLLRLLLVLSVAGIVTAGIVVLVRADRSYELTGLRGVLGGTTVPFVLMAWLLGSSSIGAEWRAGTVVTQLTWEPRRIRLIVAKATAAALVCMALFVVLQALLAASLLPGILSKGTTTGAGATWLRGLAGLVLRGTVLAGVGALIGFAVGMIGRNTAVALGAGFVYLAILEGGLLGGIYPGIRRWLLIGNSIVFVGGAEAPDVVGRSVLGAGIVLVLYGLGAMAVAAAVFRARDVT